MAKCSGCNRDAMKDSEYCFFCNPDISDAEKHKARAKGGYATRILPHGLNSADILPIETAQDLKNFLNVLLAKSVDEIEDVRGMIKTALPIVEKISDVLRIELLEQLSIRVRTIEAKQSGRLIDVNSNDPPNFDQS